MISYGKHSVSTQDINAVTDVLENHFLTQGSKVPEFEKLLCAYTSASYCAAVNSGTSGLHVACLAVGVGPGDIVWTSPNSFAASANCALYCGASVDFVDINPVTRNMCLVLLKQKMLQAHKTNSLPKAIVVVHFAGSSCDMQSIYELCKPLDIAIIEDAAHGLGGTYKNKPIGSCEYSDIAVLSFHPVKSITTAEGGALTTNNPDLAQKCKLFANHGITKDQDHMQGDIHGKWYYQQLCLGYNYRMSDLHAALGISQLSRVDAFIASRRKLAARYFDKLSKMAAKLLIKLPTDKDLNESSWHLFMIELTTHNRKQVYDKLHDLGVGVNVHYIPIHLHPYYQKLGFTKGQFPHAEDFYDNALTIPLYVDLSDEEQDKVINTLTEVLS
jgi:UDP-4-amino-4,6-dideoxy-N-acetyl-beta-L-altrosamine transaminase